MIEFILIWLLWWLLVIATLQFVYKGKYWFMRYVFLICLPVTLIALIIARVIIMFMYNGVTDFFKYSLTFLFKGWDYETANKNA